ncbi:hypothetical protein Chor_011014 [Crotalus horridus]
MATQVEALLPANPLLPAEEHGLVIKKPQEKGEHLMHQGEKANADEDKGGGPDSCSKEEGGGGGNVGDHLRRNGALLKPPSIKQQKEDSNHQEKENLLHQRSGCIESNRLPGEASSSSSGGEEGGEQGGVGRKEFIEAPPPKVNPWTKNAPVALVTLNGQSPPGGTPPCLCPCTPTRCYFTRHSVSLLAKTDFGGGERANGGR